MIRALLVCGSVVAAIFLCGALPAQAIVLDGDLSDWTAADRLDTAPGSGQPGYEVYGRYEAPTYFLAISTDGTPVGQATTIWLNTDQNASTGHQIFGFAGGAEFNVNVFSDGQPYLYTGAAAENFVTGPLPHAFGSGGSVIELAIDESLLAVAPPQDIDLLIDVSDAVFLPPDYSLFVYTLTTAVAPSGIVVDGDLGDWTPADSLGSAPQVPSGWELYGKKEGTDYVIALRTDGVAIGAGTTFWLNTDENTATGHQVFGFAGGAEFNVNFFVDGQPYLYSGAAGEVFLTGPLTHAFGAGGTVVEFSIPEDQLGVPGFVQNIGLLIDVNNAIFLPPDYSIDPQFLIATGNAAQVPTLSEAALLVMLLLLTAGLAVRVVATAARG